MAVKVIGKYLKQFTNKDTGEQITYARVFASIDEEELLKTVHYDGDCVDVLKCPVNLYDTVSVGQMYNPIYNRYGGISDFILYSGGNK